MQRSFWKFRPNFPISSFLGWILMCSSRNSVPGKISKFCDMFSKVISRLFWLWNQSSLLQSCAARLHNFLVSKVWAFYFVFSDFQILYFWHLSWLTPLGKEILEKPVSFTHYHLFSSPRYFIYNVQCLFVVIGFAIVVAQITWKHLEEEEKCRKYLYIYFTKSSHIINVF